MPVIGGLPSGGPARAWRHSSARKFVTAAILVIAVGTSLSCETQDDAPTPTRAADSASTSATPRPTGSPTPQESPAPRVDDLGALPELPTTRSAATLARQISVAEGILGDRRAQGRDVRRAGEFGQLAARRLANAPGEFRRKVLTRLGPRIQAKTRLDVEAAVELNAMTSPQARLPDWRIVQPPPPEVLLGHYRFAARRIGVPWNYLAAIHLVETRMGRIRGVSSAGALGPMQFLPTTWDLYGEGGDINDPRDAILAAARLLKANGAPEDMQRAVWHYNPSSRYVGAVTRYAEAMDRSALAYRGYWHWRVLYKHVRGTYLLGRGYPEVPARLLGRA